MTSAQRGEGGVKNCPILQMNSTDRLREMRMKGGGVVKKSKNFKSFKYGPTSLSSPKVAEPQ